VFNWELGCGVAGVGGEKGDDLVFIIELLSQNRRMPGQPAMTIRDESGRAALEFFP
jgi:hypothetical protein